MKTSLRSGISPILCMAGLVVLTCAFTLAAQDPPPPQACIQFDGERGRYVEIDDSPDFSVSARGLTVSAWVRPDSFLFPIFNGPAGCGYVHWLGKGTAGRHEWTFRMYREDALECLPSPPRPQRTSCYVFNPEGGQGVGSYFQESLKPGVWFHIVGVIDAVGKTTTIYRDGVFKDVDSYCPSITPRRVAPAAPLRLGTRDLGSFFQGALAELRIWNRPLRDLEVANLYSSGVVPEEGLVAEYLLNEGEGDEVHDTAGGHANGRVVGATWCPASGAKNSARIEKGQAVERPRQRHNHD